ATEKGVELPRQLEHAGLDEGAALTDELEAGFLHPLVVGAGSILERGGGEEDTRNGNALSHTPGCQNGSGPFTLRQPPAGAASYHRSAQDYGPAASVHP